MDRNTRLRRVVIVCELFTRNLAYYRAGWNGEDFKKEGDFWITINGDFLDICVLEWCKLFGEKRGKHDWRKIYQDHKQFKTEMFAELKMNQTKLDQIFGSIKHYRDKFVAHLDDEKTMNIPKLDLAKETVEFYHSKVVAECSGTSNLAGRVTDLKAYYDKCYKEAEAYYK